MTPKDELWPLGDRILLERVDTSKVGGIFVPTDSEAALAAQPYRIVRLSNSASRATDSSTTSSGRVMRQLHVGDVVYIARMKGFAVDFDGEELMMVDAANVLGVVMPSAAKEAAEEETN